MQESIPEKPLFDGLGLPAFYYFYTNNLATGKKNLR